MCIKDLFANLVTFSHEYTFMYLLDDAYFALVTVVKYFISVLAINAISLVPVIQCII